MHKSRKKAIDLTLEHINFYYHMDMKLHKNSTHDVAATFGRVALAAPLVTGLNESWERYFGQRTDGKHAYKNAANDIFALASLLREVMCTASRTSVDVPGQFESPDVYTDGLKLLGEKIDDFNMRFREVPGQLRKVPDGEDGVDDATGDWIARCEFDMGMMLLLLALG